MALTLLHDDVLERPLPRNGEEAAARVALGEVLHGRFDVVVGIRQHLGGGLGMAVLRRRKCRCLRETGSPGDDACIVDGLFEGGLTYRERAYV